MAALKPSKDIIKTLPEGIQMATIDQLNTNLSAKQAAEAKAAIDNAVVQILTTTPTLTIEDGEKLQAWQEARESGRPTTDQ